jgi:hypothetical protein
MPIPALIAGGAALIGGMISANAQSKAAEQERKARQAAANELRNQGQITTQQYQALINEINNYYATRPTIGQKGDLENYRQAIYNYKPEDFVADTEPFSYNKTKEDFLNPYYAAIIGDTANQIQHSAAGAGLGRGTGAALNIAKGTAEKSDELYRTALGEYNQDRNFAYQQYADAIRNNQNRLNALRSATESKLNMQGNLANEYVGAQDARMSDILKAQQDSLASRQAYDTAIAGLY